MRQLDQIYMKTGDMVLQSEFVEKWADQKKAFGVSSVMVTQLVCVCVAGRRGAGAATAAARRVRLPFRLQLACRSAR
jgi:hypothetical protein